MYPVVSRRAGGVSVASTSNVNNACNWACVYCQVENLTRGGPPAVDLELFEQELAGFLDDALMGDFMVRAVPAEDRRLVDVAFPGTANRPVPPIFRSAPAGTACPGAARAGQQAAGTPDHQWQPVASPDGTGWHSER